jgi:hypothetical protein
VRAGCRWAAGGAVAGFLAAALVPWPGLHWREGAPIVSTAARIFEHDQGTGRERLEDHVMGFHLWKSHPILGVGPRGWDDASSAEAHRIPGRHAAERAWAATPNSDLVRIGAEQGALGLVTLIGALFVLIRTGLRARGVDELDGHRTAALLALLPLCVHGLLDAPLFRVTSTLVFAVLAGVLRPVRRETTANVRSAVRWSFAFAAVVSMLGLGARTVASGLLVLGDGNLEARMLALRLYPRSALAETTAMWLAQHGQCDEADKPARMAMQWSPHHFGVPLALAECLEFRGEVERAKAFREAAERVEPHTRSAVEVSATSQRR